MVSAIVFCGAACTSLRAFVERMTKINRGRALYTRPDRLGEYLLVDYLSQKRKKI